MIDAIVYSVVVPVYNSETSLCELCTRITNTLSQFSFEIILVDDGSIDKSWQIIEQLKTDHQKTIKAVQLQKNYGQQAALLCAFGFCKGSFIITIDDDLQYSPEDILLLIQKQKEINADIVYGIANKKYHSPIRNLGSNYVQYTSRVFEGYQNRGCSFRLLNQNIVQAITENHNNSFISLDNILRWYTSSIAFVDVPHYPRLSGSSGYNMVKLLKLHHNAITSYSITPLKIMTYTGFIFSIIFFVVGVIFIYHKLAYKTPMGFTSIIVAILFSSSIIMFCLGVIGQYLFKMYISQQNKPLYTIKQII